MGKTKFEQGDMTQLSETMVIPEGVRFKNIQLAEMLLAHQRPNFLPTDNDLGIIISSIIAGNYIGYVWFSQMRLKYYLVFEEELKKV